MKTRDKKPAAIEDCKETFTHMSCDTMRFRYDPSRPKFDVVTAIELGDFDRGYKAIAITGKSERLYSFIHLSPPRASWLLCPRTGRGSPSNQRLRRSTTFQGKICRNRLHILENSLVELAIRVFPEEIAMYGISSHRTPSVADSQVSAVQAVFLQDQLSWSGLKMPTGFAVPQQVREAAGVKNIAEPGFGIAGHPAITLSHITSRIDANELVDAVVTPNAEQVLLPINKIVEQLIDGTDSNPTVEALLHPYIGEIRQKAA
jgi:hypothetical protein